MPHGKGMYGRLWTNDNVEEMQRRVDEYFDAHPDKSKPPTLSGLVHALGASSPRSLEQWMLNTSPGVERVADVVAEAIAQIRECYETWGILHNGNPAFHIFMLKNMGLTDRQDIAVEGVDTFLADLNKAIRNKEDRND